MSEAGHRLNIVPLYKVSNPLKSLKETGIFLFKDNALWPQMVYGVHVISLVMVEILKERGPKVQNRM